MDLLTKLYLRMLARTQKGMQEAMSQTLDELARDALNPMRLAELMKSLGIDSSRLANMMGKGSIGDAPYAVLGLSKDCTDEEVRKNYLKIISQIHPDKGGSEMTFLASLVNRAYQTICKERGIS